MWSGVLLVGILLAGISALVNAQATRTVQDGVFRDAQARRGQGLYADQCGLCHGDMLEGSQGPPLTGDFFISRWSAQPLSDLANKIRNTMPAGAPGSLMPGHDILRSLGISIIPASVTLPPRLFWCARCWARSLSV